MPSTSLVWFETTVKGILNGAMINILLLICWLCDMLLMSSVSIGHTCLMQVITKVLVSAVKIRERFIYFCINQEEHNQKYIYIA